MSEAANSLREREEARRSEEPLALPQWTLELARPGVRLLSRALWRVSFRGVECVPKTGGLIIAANHQTYIDPFWISIPIKRPIRYLAWSEAFEWPFIGRAIELLGAWPLTVERANPAAYRRAVKWLKGGGAVMIFPEGARSKADGEMARFKPGAARLALEADVPILPVTLRGGNQVWPRGQARPRTGRIEIIYHAPRRVAVRDGEEARLCAQRETESLAAVIKSGL